jgi:pimeloyl-ACP methyl ester carboxylesterase
LNARHAPDRVPLIAVPRMLSHMPIFFISLAALLLAPDNPPPPGRLVDIGGQKIHLNCTGHGSPTVVLESGVGDFSVVWSLVQPSVAAETRVCSYDRGGYAWSEPGARPRTFAQLALELRTALARGGERGPFVLVGQSYGGLVVRGFAARYRSEVAGMVLVDAVHEDQHVVYGGQPHRIRDEAKGRTAPPPHVALDTSALHAKPTANAPPADAPLDAPLDRLPAAAQAVWRWAQALPTLPVVWAAETDWSPEELARFHAERLTNRATLGDLPLVVLARTRGGFESGMRISADSLERERVALQKDLAALSRQGRLIVASHAGHNVHIEEPKLVVDAVTEVVRRARN